MLLLQHPRSQGKQTKDITYVLIKTLLAGVVCVSNIRTRVSPKSNNLKLQKHLTVTFQLELIDKMTSNLFYPPGFSMIGGIKLKIKSFSLSEFWIETSNKPTNQPTLSTKHQCFVLMLPLKWDSSEWDLFIQWWSF